MHPAAGAKWTFLSDLDDAVQLVSCYDSRHLKLVLDCYDWGRDYGLEERLGKLVPHIALVQLADGKQAPCGERNRCPLGTGKIPLPQLLRQLDRANYRGPYEVELLGEEIEACDYESLLRDSMRRLREWRDASQSSALKSAPAPSC
jgi:sugar phosphate isomerase/epimerase